MAKPFTSENAREMQARSAKKRRENSQKFREQMQDELINSKGDVLAKKLLSQDDWRAWIAAVEQAFGKPTAPVEVTGEDGGPIEVEHKGGLTLADVARFAQPLNGPDEGSS